MKTYYLPEGYIENALLSSDNVQNYWKKSNDKLKYLWQEPVYKYALKIIEENSFNIVFDIGCGTGFKTIKYFNKLATVYGIDQKSGINFTKQANSINWFDVDLNSTFSTFIPNNIKPDFIIISDVIEHLENPISFLLEVSKLMDTNTMLLVSTPDRNYIEGHNKLGPPLNKLHIREWNHSEFKQFLNEQNFEILESIHFYPRVYPFSLREVFRFLFRIIRFKKYPDNKLSMAFLLKKKGQ